MRSILTAAVVAAVAAVVVPAAVANAASPPSSTTCASPAAVKVSTAAGLTQALAAAGPGTMISVAPGTYVGTFALRGAGTAKKPIALCGPRTAVLTAGVIDRGYTLHLDGASYWQVSGFTVRGGLKGVMADNAQANRIEGLLIDGVGDEALHLRRGSSDNLVRGNTIQRAGLRTPAIGEGVYVGSAQSNWCELTVCAPDRSDRNTVENATVDGTGHGFVITTNKDRNQVTCTNKVFRAARGYANVACR